MSIESVMPSNHLTPLSPPSPPALNLSQHQDLFQSVGSSHQVAKVLQLQLQHQSFQAMFKVDILELSFNAFLKTNFYVLLQRIAYCELVWLFYQFSSVQFSRSVMSDSFETPWIATHQASLSVTNSRSSLRPTSIESVMPSSHLILCRPLLLPSIPPSIRVFSNESTLRMRWPKYWLFYRVWKLF